MRNQLLNLLRTLETESGFKNEYSEFWESYGCNYSVEEYLDFPNYRFITQRFNGLHAKSKEEGGLIYSISSGSILAELKRMEADGLVIVGIQTGRRYASAIGNGPDFNEGEGASFSTESVVLTTHGKSAWHYFLHTITKNPFSNILAVLAIIVSIIALFI